MSSPKPCYKDVVEPYAGSIMNFSIHVLIIFSFVALFYLFYAQGVARDNLHGQVDAQIARVVDGIKLDDPQLKSALRAVLPLKRLSDTYSAPDPVLAENNKWASYNTKFTLGAIWLFTFVVVIGIKYVLCAEASLMQVVWDNVFTFVLMGVVEYLFFTRIIVKYAPIAPSEVARVFMNKLMDMTKV